MFTLPDQVRTCVTPLAPPHRNLRPAGERLGGPFYPAAWDWKMPDSPARTMRQATGLPGPLQARAVPRPSPLFFSGQPLCVLGSTPGAGLFLARKEQKGGVLTLSTPQASKGFGPRDNIRRIEKKKESSKQAWRVHTF
ncbi:hypothetical protein AAY473_015191 [Plecturocebus cupreus]